MFFFFTSDLIDGNVKSVLSLCRNVKSQFEVSSTKSQPVYTVYTCMFLNSWVSLWEWESTSINRHQWIKAEGNPLVDKHPIQGVWGNGKTLWYGPLGLLLFCCGIDLIIINDYDNVHVVTLYLCLLLKGGGWMSPDGARPGSSGSTKEEDFRLANGMVPHSHTTNG